jgi:hypothetical protein
MPPMDSIPHSEATPHVTAGQGHPGRHRPLHWGAVFSASLLVACGEMARGRSRFLERGHRIVWSLPSAPAHTAAATPARPPVPQPAHSVMRSGRHSVAAVVVLVDQNRRINLSRLGGLQGP